MVIEYLDVGEENAKTNEELSRFFGLDGREMRDLIRKARLAGEPICATNKGYFKPATIDDLKKSVSRLYKQAREIRKSAEAMNNIVKSGGINNE